MDIDIRREVRNREDYNLKGQVRLVEQKPYKAKAKGGFIALGEEDDEDYFEKYFLLGFDENGHKTDVTYYSHTKSYMKFIYDDNGMEVEWQTFENGVLKNYTQNEYNEFGLLSKQKYVNAIDNQITSSSEKIYDEKNHQIKHISFDNDNLLNFTEEYKNNEIGAKIEQKRIKADGSIDFWSLYKNNGYGHVIETTRLLPDGSIDKVEKKTWEYDSKGKLIGMDGTRFTRNSSYAYLELEYDHYGNWISRLEFQKKIPNCFQFRKISYYGKEESAKDFSDFKIVAKVPYDMEKIDEITAKADDGATLPPLETPLETGLDAENADWISENCPFNEFPLIRYYALQNNDLPSIAHFYGDDGDALKLMGKLRDEMSAKLLHTYSNFNAETAENDLKSYTLSFPHKGYILQMNHIQIYPDAEYDIPEYFFGYYPVRREGYVYIGQIILLHPNEFSDKRDEDFEKELEAYIDECKLKELPELPEIQMIEVSTQGSYYLKSYPLNDNFIINELDMHYGYGFEKFHKDLLKRFQEGSYGLVLLHGEPGTGKTYYIRHLLRKMNDSNKVVIYMPPNMIDYILNPVFMTFLTNEISMFSKEGKTCVLLIEDAEPLLASRSETGRVIGVSNLLNLTDGLLNDLLKLQIICTFNVKIKELDKALLRPGRLIARKEFKAMSMIDANRLAQQLGIKHLFIKPATLAEVYALLKDKNTLTHTVI